MKLLIVFGLPIVIAFFFQVLVGCKTKHKVLQYVPFYCFGVCLLFAMIALSANPGFFMGGNVIAAVIWGMIGFCFLIGYGLAMLYCRWKKE